jgi:putative tricarboxylic transport membrane protein
LNSEYIAFTVKADSPIKSGKDLLDRLRQNPSLVSIAFSNIGSANHIGAGVLFKAAGLDVKKAKLVAFKGASEAVTALLGGHVDAIASSASSVQPQVQAGTPSAAGGGFACRRARYGVFASRRSAAEQRRARGDSRAVSEIARP